MAADGTEAVTLAQAAAAFGITPPDDAPDVGGCILKLSQLKVLVESGGGSGGDGGWVDVQFSEVPYSDGLYQYYGSYGTLRATCFHRSSDVVIEMDMTQNDGDTHQSTNGNGYWYSINPGDDSQFYITQTPYGAPLTEIDGFSIVKLEGRP